LGRGFIIGYLNEDKMIKYLKIIFEKGQIKFKLYDFDYEKILKEKTIDLQNNITFKLYLGYLKEFLKENEIKINTLLYQTEKYALILEYEVENI
jgi:hypothetical protein